MMIKIKLFTSTTCEELLNYKSDDEIRNLYNDSSFDFKNAEFINDNININLNDNEFDLGIKPSDDLESSIKIFSALKQLDLVQANDKRLWVTLTHTIFYKYAKQRWGINNSSSNDVIKDRFHFEGAGLRARNQNSIARLWWASRITYDETLQDPFELTKILWEKQDFYQNLIDRKFSTYKATLNGFLKFYSMNKHLDLKLEMRKIFKGLNAYGGVRILSMLEEEEVKYEINRLCRFYKIETNAA